jgi:hypothetical protein
MRSNTFKKAASLGLLFIVLVIGGRFLFGDNKVKVQDVTPEKSTSTSPSPQTPSSRQTVTVAPGSNNDQTVSTCIAALRKETTAAKREYEKGSMLVTFKSGISFDEAKAILATYGVSIKSETSSKASFSSRQLITGAFTPGEEFSKICIVRQDERIKFAGLNVIFNLHE